MELLNSWFDHLMNASSLALRVPCSARGEYRRLGDPPWFAAVTLTIEPSDTLQVESVLDTSLVDDLKKQGLYNQILFGVLDVMLT